MAGTDLEALDHAVLNLGGRLEAPYTSPASGLGRWTARPETHPRTYSLVPDWELYDD